jgi:hypothetical protein
MFMYQVCDSAIAAGSWSSRKRSSSDVSRKCRDFSISSALCCRGAGRSAGCTGRAERGGSPISDGVHPFIHIG